MNKEKKSNRYEKIVDIQRVLKIWKTRNLTLEVKMVYFKAVVISKFAFQSFKTTSQNKLEKKAFFGITLFLR